jgi:cyclopropane fatty-acyl-phospholipid synthase-like methyltransferase
LKKIFKHYGWKLPSDYENIELKKIKYTGVGTDRINNESSNDRKPLYNEGYFLNRVEGWQQFKKGQISPKKIDFMDDISVKDMKILDVGFGRGELLQTCKMLGAKKCIGLDFSEAASIIAKKWIDESIKLYTLDISDANKIREKDIDIVFMIDIIEHVNDTELSAFFESIKLKVNESTKFVITTPTNIFRGDYKNMHINQWTREKIIDYFGKFFGSIEVMTKRDGGQFQIVLAAYNNGEKND